MRVCRSRNPSARAARELHSSAAGRFPWVMSGRGAGCPGGVGGILRCHSYICQDPSRRSRVAPSSSYLACQPCSCVNQCLEHAGKGNGLSLDSVTPAEGTRHGQRALQSAMELRPGGAGASILVLWLPSSSTVPDPVDVHGGPIFNHLSTGFLQGPVHTCSVKKDVRAD